MTTFAFLDSSAILQLPGLSIEFDVKYLPKPNSVDVVLTDLLAPDVLTPTAFVFPFLEDGRAVLSVNQKRGVEIPGGHRDPLTDGTLETPVQAAVREGKEEAGVTLSKIVPVGFLRGVAAGPKPDPYKYPYPVSCQQYFAGIVSEIGTYVENHECRTPMVLDADEAGGMLGPRIRTLFDAARATLFPERRSTATP